MLVSYIVDCRAHKDRTGAFTCNRCGYQWDADDDPPTCKTWQDIKAEKKQRKRAERQAARQHGNDILKQLREDLEK